MAHNFSIAQSYSAVASAGIAYLEMKTPATGSIKVKAAAHSTGATHKVELIEAPTLTTGATAVIPVNKDRESAVKSAMAVKSNPTGVSAGTVIDVAFAYELNPTEYALKKDTVYLVKVTNTEAAAKDITILVDYTEDAVKYEYPVTFTVTDGSAVAIKDASVTFAGETKLTAADGTASFTVRPADYTFSVSKATLETETGSISVTNKAEAKAVTLDAPADPTYDVIIQVTDSIMGKPIEGVSVVLGVNDAEVTDENGVVVFEDQDPAVDVAYTATVDGYTIEAGVITIEDEDVYADISAVQTVYTVTFTVTLDSDPVNYCRVDFRGYTQRTNELGVLEVANVVPGEYPYTAMYNGGYYVAGTVTVEAADVAEAVALVIPQ